MSAELEKMRSDIAVLSLNLHNLEIVVGRLSNRTEDLAEKVATFNGSIESIKTQHAEIVKKHESLSARFPIIDARLSEILKLTKKNAEDRHPGLRVQTMKADPTEKRSDA